MRQIRDPQQETNCVQNVTLSGSIETGDSVEFRIESVNFRPLSVGFESVDDDVFDVHVGTFKAFKLNKISKLF